MRACVSSSSLFWAFLGFFSRGAYWHIQQAEPVQHACAWFEGLVWAEIGRCACGRYTDASLPMERNTTFHSMVWHPHKNGHLADGQWQATKVGL